MADNDRGNKGFGRQENHAIPRLMKTGILPAVLVVGLLIIYSMTKIWGLADEAGERG